ncbi:hypothetical protein SMICM304S_07696 [Streptomyces microflavus]
MWSWGSPYPTRDASGSAAGISRSWTRSAGGAGSRRAPAAAPLRGPIAENVRLARPDADDAAVVAALRDAGAYDFVAELPDGERTLLGEDGAGLSAGQRQRLAIARAFLADRPLLLLDEPTASLDGETEAGIVDAVRRLAAGRTVLLVVHRPALLAVADRVVTLEPRAVEAQGPAASVVAPGLPVPQPLAGGEPLDARRPGDVLEAADLLEPGDVREGDTALLRETDSRPGRVLARVREAAGAQRGQLALALLLGSLAVGSAVGLMAVSGWLISRASEQPPVLYLMMAVTATRAFGIGRAVFRYAERLVSHDAVLKLLAELRVAVYRGLERVAPAGLRTVRRGDLLARLVADVDALQNWLRWVLPAGTALTVSVAAAGFTGWLLPPKAGVVLAVGLLVAGVGVPLVSGAFARRTERQLAPARAALATRVTDLLGEAAGRLGASRRGACPGPAGPHCSSSNQAAGPGSPPCGRRRRRPRQRALRPGLRAHGGGRRTRRRPRRERRPAGRGHARGGGAHPARRLRGRRRTAARGPVPRQRVLRSAERIYEVLDAPVPVREPAAPADAPSSPFPLEVRGLSARYPGARHDALRSLDLTLVPGRRIAVVGPPARARRRSRRCSSASWTPRRGRTASVVWRRTPWTATPYGAPSACVPRTPTSSTARSARTCGSAVPGRATPSCTTRSPGPAARVGPLPAAGGARHSGG